MFYSHEVLTSRKYGVATVWLVATLGAKSTHKRVSRKAILDVDVQKACDTIERPEAPMALRLQSNLLYGVTRVYSQQCGYVLTDAEAAKNNMKAIFRVIRASGLEAEGGTKGRADQLLLPDDPNFLPDFDLVPIDLEQLDLNFDPSSVHAAEESQRSTLSPHNSQLVFGSQDSLPMLNIPGRSSSLFGGPVGGGGSFGIRGDSGAGTGMRYRDERFLDDDLGITVEPDGTMRFSEEPARRSVVPSGRVDKIAVGDAGSRLEAGYEHGGPGRSMPGQVDNDGFMPLQDDDDDYGANTGDAEAFPSRHGAEEALQQHTTSETVAAPARHRNKPAPEVLTVDTTMELRNGDLARWNTDYVANMLEVTRHKHASRATAIAKDNARHWVLGAGNLGALSQSDMLVNGPLGMFSGARLLEALTGLDLTGTGEKRGRDLSDDEDGTRKRSRTLDEPSSDELGRGLEHQYDDGYMTNTGDDYTGVEQGRGAPTPLDDRHLSSIFPWNRSTGGSRRPTGVFTSATLAGAAGIGTPAGGGLPMSRRASRLQSASPLVGRALAGTAAAALAEAGMDDMGLDQDPYGAEPGLAMSGLTSDFELFGPAAEVDTQTAAQSQWQRAALDTESAHFLGFVQAAVAEAEARHGQLGAGEHDDEELVGSVEFGELLPPERNTCVVAAQALLHVLTLGTKGLLDVEQEEAFGGIMLRAVAV
ncbi:R8 protein [Friedmanniomyces endolithicus]|uniref:R8 protein n=1 Tax=Friedmanniomyces endolithicus TaxID=329885 RepID=A0AAN6QTS0_9PEZI|nr:R8 protein [Friedmanniomyces endolithicus]KAK0283058.1 R8 protein [Friedmanniomyces endolithicus]KAK0318360.1 R8 protein [Friedmanniomyces endolithicus]KAK0927468.1 R8 protein [Friedmanniomyces endolithicus]KAK0986524.1 R8 protein [Friedmanniomyces endolithicus]